MVFIEGYISNLINHRSLKWPIILVICFCVLIAAETAPKEDEETKPTLVICCYIINVIIKKCTKFQPPNPETTSGTVVENVGFLHAFVASLSVILVSEIGDKTFFIAAIMAMRHPRLIVFGGAISALALMTILSGKFRFTLLLPKKM